MKKKILIPIALLLILLITNPTNKDFTDFSGNEGGQSVRRTTNFIIGSIYKVHSSNLYSHSYTDATYLGALKNFISISNKITVLPNPDNDIDSMLIKVDTSMVVIDSVK